MPPPPEIEREIVKLEIDGIKMMYESMLRWLQEANGDGVSRSPHQIHKARHYAEKSVNRYFSYVDRVMEERIARGSFVIESKENDRTKSA